jgi:hypothetical protein
VGFAELGFDELELFKGRYFRIVRNFVLVFPGLFLETADVWLPFKVTADWPVVLRISQLGSSTGALQMAGRARCGQPAVPFRYPCCAGPLVGFVKASQRKKAGIHHPQSDR